MQSMTGFGRASVSTEELDVTVEIRSVNSRYLDLNLRLSRELGWLDPELRKLLQACLSRGRVELNLDLRVKTSDRYELDEGLARSYLSAAERVRTLGAQGELNVAGLLQLPGVMVPKGIDPSSEGVLEEIRKVVQQAIARLVKSRGAEGNALRDDLGDRIARLVALVDEISTHTDGMVQHYSQKLEKRIAALGQSDQLDPGRLAQEIVFYADRCDVTEEITRLRSHLEQFQKALDREQAGVVGRRLDFITQELGREINTVLSKSSQPRLSELAVEGKTEIEKIREQVQNVE